MSRRGLALSVSHLQGVAAAALFAVAFALAVIPSSDGAAPDPERGSLRQEAPAPAADTPAPVDPTIWTASTSPVRAAKVCALAASSDGA